jgi:cytochrome P450
MRAGTYQKAESRDLLTYIYEDMFSGGPAKGLTEYHLLGHMLQFMAAGGDTSANTLSWSVYVIAKYKDTQDKLRAKIQSLHRTQPNPPCSDIDALPYLEAFIKEALRIYSPAAIVHRQAIRATTLDNLLVQEGTVVDGVWAVGDFNPLIWSDDVDEFKPERWYLENMTKETKNLYTFKAFSNRPRICIGKATGMVALKTTFVEMVGKWRFLEVVTEPVIENPSLVLKPTGLKVRVARL